VDASGDPDTGRALHAADVIIAAARSDLRDSDLLLRALSCTIWVRGSVAEFLALAAAALEAAPAPARRDLTHQIANHLIWAGETHKAWETLGRIPPSNQDQTTRDLYTEIRRWQQVENHEAFTSWQRLGTDWWLDGPAVLPAEDRGRPLRRWMSGRLEGRWDDKVCLHVAIVNDDPPGITPGATSIDHDIWLARTGQEIPDGPCQTTSVWEIGKYGGPGSLIVPVPSTLTRTLPTPDPHPFRYANVRAGAA